MSRISEYIATDITSDYCTVRYATGCTDSLRHLEVTATSGGEIARADTVFVTPSRPDTLRLFVEPSIEEVTPPGQFTVAFRLEPGLHTELPLRFSFYIGYNERALKFISQINTGTMLDGADISLTPVQPGLLLCSSYLSYPAISQGNFISARFEALTTAGSTPVFITIDSIEFAAGCPNTVITFPDTVFVCRCSYALPIDARPVTIITGDEAEVPVMLPDTLIYGNSPYDGDMLFSMNLYFDSTFFEPLGVDGFGTISENAVLKWSVRNGDTLEVRSVSQFTPGPGLVLFNARFKVKQPKSAQHAQIGVPSIRLFTACCYSQSDSLPNTILIDGLCDKIVRRRADFTLEPNSPNPAQGETNFRFTVHERERFSESQATLTLYRSDGTVVGEIYNNTVRAGEYTVPFITTDLPAGTYYYTLSISERVQTRSMVVVR